ncbi:MAG TPA: ORF6N domain-containing protein [Sulfurovum sp.]|nr:ORF6N domain-containing protein [Sulfurovum sp.]
MDELIVQGEINSKILTLRGKQVMLDRDLAELYGVETKYLKRQVQRNIERFNEDDFMFVTTKEEFENLRSQIGTANFSKTRALPYAFTEQGIYMLATVINSPIAIDISKNIMRTFTKLREFSKHYNALAKQLIEIDRKHDKQYKELKRALDELIVSTEVIDVVRMGFLRDE